MGRCYQDRDDEKQEKAIQFAIESGVLKYCEVHDDVLLECGVDILAAYQHGNAEFTAGRLDGIFDSRREMTDLIKAIVEGYAGYRCEKCADPD